MREEKFLSFSGRLSSRDYFARAIAMQGMIVMFLFMSDTISMSLKIFCYIVAAISFAIWQIQTIKRLHDINRSGWYSMLLLIPIINIFFSFYLMIKRGDKETNVYGKNPFAA